MYVNSCLVKSKATDLYTWFLVNCFVMFSEIRTHFCHYWVQLRNKSEVPFFCAFSWLLSPGYLLPDCMWQVFFWIIYSCLRPGTSEWNVTLSYFHLQNTLQAVSILSLWHLSMSPSSLGLPEYGRLAQIHADVLSQLTMFYTLLLNKMNRRLTNWSAFHWVLLFVGSKLWQHMKCDWSKMLH